MTKVPVLKKILSYLVPVRIRRRSSNINPVLDLYLYRGQWQLATADALYSDGDRYRPLVMAFKKIKDFLPQIKEVLVLGTGLGSAARILHKTGCIAKYTLVDIDAEVLKWALELMPSEIARDTTPVCADAAVFISGLTKTYDLLVLDIFISRVVPVFAVQEGFLEKCRRSINSGGHFIMNYIVNDEQQWKQLQDTCNKVFPGYRVIENGINRIMIATV
ncbi:spermidine synthase [Chitinophagaceae bacterium MMS25-I14]